MGMIVKMNPGSDPVSARVTIEGIVYWAFLFSSPDHTYKRSGTSSVPNDLPLGLPSDLHLDPHEWTIHLADLTPNDVPYEARVEFIQGGKVLDTWLKQGTVKSVDEVILEDRAILIVKPSIVGGR